MIDYETAYACASNMLSIKKDIKSEVDDIKGILQTLKSSGEWNSLGSSYYMENINTAFEQFDGLFSSLDIFINQMNVSIDRYKEFEKQIVETSLFGTEVK